MTLTQGDSQNLIHFTVSCFRHQAQGVESSFRIQSMHIQTGAQTCVHSRYSEQTCETGVHGLATKVGLWWQPRQYLHQVRCKQVADLLRGAPKRCRKLCPSVHLLTQYHASWSHSLTCMHYNHNTTLSTSVTNMADPCLDVILSWLVEVYISAVHYAAQLSQWPKFPMHGFTPQRGPSLMQTHPEIASTRYADCDSLSAVIYLSSFNWV